MNLTKVDVLANLLANLELFWYMSLLGSAGTLSYFLFSAKQDSVGVLQNLFPIFTALYSLYLDVHYRRWNRDKLPESEQVRR